MQRPDIKKLAKPMWAHKGFGVCSVSVSTRPPRNITAIPKCLRKRAAEMYVGGGNLRRIGRHLKVSPQTVLLSVMEVAEALPNAPVPQEAKEAEMDEIFTFIRDKKTEFTL